MAYITVPKVLLGHEYKSVSPEAKLLFALMLDRTSLSARNGDEWKTQDGKIYIYCSNKEICSTMGCGHDKATKMLRELEAAGLIRRNKQGLTKSDQIIVNSAFLHAEKSHSISRNARVPECGIPSTNNPNQNKTEYINPHQQLTHNRKATEAIIKEKISFDVLILEIEKWFVDTVVSVVTNALCNPKPILLIAGLQREKEDIYRRLISIDDMHVRYAFDRTKSSNQEIRSLHAYILARLFLACEEMDIYYEAKVATDEWRAGR